MTWRNERRRERRQDFTFEVLKEALELIRMGQKTNEAVQELLAEVAEDKTKLEGYKTWMAGEPERTAAAVADALAAANVDDATAAGLITQARDDLSDAVDQAAPAINTAPDGGPAPNAPDSPDAAGSVPDEPPTATDAGTLTPNPATTSPDGVTPDSATPQTPADLSTAPDEQQTSSAGSGPEVVASEPASDVIADDDETT